MELTDIARTFSALGNEGRLAIFRLIVEAGPRGLPSGEVARRAGKVQNTVSSSLRILTDAGLIVARREGRSVIYSAIDANLFLLREFLSRDVAESSVAETAGRTGSVTD